MFRVLAVSAVLFISAQSFSQSKRKPLRVVVVDTGLDPHLENLCDSGHRSFTGGLGLGDDNGHGTHVAGLINQHAKNADYCLISAAFYRDSDPDHNHFRFIEALRYAVSVRPDVINISAGGSSPHPEERALIKQALDMGVVVVAAAGNDGDNLDAFCNYYPACYDKRIIVVGNLTQTSSLWVRFFGVSKVPKDPKYDRAENSNYGSVVDAWEVGTDVMSNLPHKAFGKKSGTSQAAGILTGKILNKVAARRLLVQQ